MAFTRRSRRLLLVFALFILLAALVSNLFLFLGLQTDDLRWRLGQLREFRPHFQLPGRRKKPWHSDEPPDEIFAPADKHLISELMQKADDSFRYYQSNRSKSFRETVRKYRERYGRHPPPGFKEWYKYARARNVHNIDDFEHIMDDLRPFWAEEPRIIRNLAANMWRDEDAGLSGIHIRNGKVLKETNSNWRSETLVSLIKKFSKYLPDMDIAMNRLDQPRVVVPWGRMQELLRTENETRSLPPQPVEHFTKDQKELALFTKAASLDHMENPEWFQWPGKQYMEVAKTACPPESPAFQATRHPDQANKFFKSDQGGLVTNFNLSTDLCTIGPQIENKHGMLYASSSMVATRRLVPVFGECKVSVNSDILFPANMYWKHDERYDYNGKYDVNWEEKQDTIVWRGVTSGGTQNSENWHEMHRQRLVQFVNGTEMNGKPVTILSEQAKHKGEYENYKKFYPSSFATEHSDVGFTETWGCIPDCDFYNDVFSIKPSMDLAEQFKDKFLVDVDGHSFSGRWHAFLESRSLGIKATIFREWHDSRLFAWRHFVPMDNRYDDVYTILTYFLGVKAPPEQRSLFGPTRENDKVNVPKHDAEGKRLADQGREWAKKVLRRDDIEVRVPQISLFHARNNIRTG